MTFALGLLTNTACIDMMENREKQQRRDNMATKKSMSNKQVRDFFIGKEKTPCPNTDKLIAGGYMQKSGDYIAYAKEQHVADPSQYWHLISSWLDRRPDDAPFNKRIQCGELLFWMAEVSEALNPADLIDLRDRILKEYVNNRREGNRIIKDACFDAIVDKVLSCPESPNS